MVTTTKLEEAVRREMLKTGRALIIDCHSFPTKPLPFEDSALYRPEICVGTDVTHTPEWLSSDMRPAFQGQGLRRGAEHALLGGAGADAVGIAPNPRSTPS